MTLIDSAMHDSGGLFRGGCQLFPRELVSYDVEAGTNQVGV